MKFQVIPYLLLIFLVSCGANDPLVRNDQPTATLFDLQKKVSNSKSEFYEMTHLNGETFKNASALSLEQNRGSGFFMLPYNYSRSIPSGEQTVSIVAHVVSAAPVLSLIHNSKTVKGNVTVDFKPDIPYQVFGYLGDNVRAVIPPLLTDGKNRIHAAIKGGRPPFALCGLS